MKISQVLINESPLVLPPRERASGDLGMVQIMLSFLLWRKDEPSGRFLNMYIADVDKRIKIYTNTPERFEPEYPLEDDAYVSVEAFYESMIIG